MMFAITLLSALLAIGCCAEMGGTVDPSVQWINTSAIDGGNTSLLLINEVSNTTSDPDSSLTDGECQLFAMNPDTHMMVRNLIDENKVNLIEYQLLFPNYTYNPLDINVSHVYRPSKWSRVSSNHGQTLLYFAFNYGIFSLMTLTFGTDIMNIEVMDKPAGCIARNRSEEQKVQIIQYLLIRDFKDEKEISLSLDERVCVEMIEGDVNGFASIKDRCFMLNMGGHAVEIGTENIWISVIYATFSIVRVGILFFGPLLLISIVGKMSSEKVPYMVRNIPRQIKTVRLIRCDPGYRPAKDSSEQHTIDLRSTFHIPKRFKRLKDFLRDLQTEDQSQSHTSVELTESDIPTRNGPTCTSTSEHEHLIEMIELKTPRESSAANALCIEKTVQVMMDSYNIRVDYRELMLENDVPVGLWNSLGQAIFLCKIEDSGPFVDCCKVRIRDGFPSTSENTNLQKDITWIQVWKLIGLVLFVLLLPTPYYIRLLVFYLFEYEETLQRRAAIARVGLKERYESSLMQYLTPTHWLFIICYLFIGFSFFVFMINRWKTNGKSGRVIKILTRCFKDLEELSWTKIMQVFVGNVIWPFQYFGIGGFCVAIAYWPVAIPISLVICIFYSLPTTYIIIRLFVYLRRNIVDKYIVVPIQDNPYKVIPQADAHFERFSMKYYFHNNALDNLSNKKCCFLFKKWCSKPLKAVLHIVVLLLCSCTLFAYLILIAECIGSLVEVMAFTLMGVIVNAGELLKYASLIILVVVYSYDSFNNVAQKYHKLNKELFKEIRGRIANQPESAYDISHSLENNAFTSKHNGDNQYPDALTEELPPGSAKNRKKYSRLKLHWNINDLTMFVDSDGMPRIPQKLFNSVCAIKVAGVPGPVHQGLLLAFAQFLKMALFICFVFIVVLSFGDVYKFSSTNQMLATLVGGLIPIILRQFLTPEKPDIEIETVSFKNKVDEVIRNLYEDWPIEDLEFKKVPPEVLPDMNNQFLIPNMEFAANAIPSVSEEVPTTFHGIEHPNKADILIFLPKEYLIRIEDE